MYIGVRCVFYICLVLVFLSSLQNLMTTDHHRCFIQWFLEFLGCQKKNKKLLHQKTKLHVQLHSVPVANQWESLIAVLANYNYQHKPIIEFSALKHDSNMLNRLSTSLCEMDFMRWEVQTGGYSNCHLFCEAAIFHLRSGFVSKLTFLVWVSASGCIPVCFSD